MVFLSGENITYCTMHVTSEHHRCHSYWHIPYPPIHIHIRSRTHSHTYPQTPGETIRNTKFSRWFPSQQKDEDEEKWAAKKKYHAILRARAYKRSSIVHTTSRRYVKTLTSMILHKLPCISSTVGAWLRNQSQSERSASTSVGIAALCSRCA